MNQQEESGATQQVLIVAGEASGDMYAAELVSDLQGKLGKNCPKFFGCGGKKMREARVETLVDIHSLAERLKGSWNSTLWVFGKAKSRLTSLFERSEPDLETLTGVLDEQGMPIPWGLMDRLYSEIDKNYLPRPLDSRGVLLRTSEIEGRHIIADDDALGWENVFAEGIEIVPLAGGHYSIFGEHIPTIARTIDRTLKHRASSQRPSTAGNADRS